MEIVITGNETMGEMWRAVYSAWSEICRHGDVYGDKVRYQFLKTLVYTELNDLDLDNPGFREKVAAYFNVAATPHPKTGEMLFTDDIAVLMALTAHAYDDDGIRFRAWARAELARLGAPGHE